MSAAGRPTALSVTAGVELAGRTCVVTGASSGLGRESARALAAAGAHVVLAARSERAVTKCRDWILDAFPAARLSMVELDLSSLTTIRAAARSICELSPTIHVLMNNAGVMFTPFCRTADGFESQFGTNHLGHFQLTRLLTPAMIAADGARVVILSSDGHRLGDVDLDDLDWTKRPYDKFAAYGASKTANALHAVELDRRLSDYGVRAVAVHPGMVATRLARHMTPEDVSAVTNLSRSNPAAPDNDPQPQMTEVLTAEQGAATQVWAAVTPDIGELGGRYLAECTIGQSADHAADAFRALALWKASEALCT